MPQSARLTVEAYKWDKTRPDKKPKSLTDTYFMGSNSGHPILELASAAEQMSMLLSTFSNLYNNSRHYKPTVITQH